MDSARLAEARQNVMEALITLPAWDADRVRILVDAAIHDGDSDAVRLEGQKWDSWAGRALVYLADRMDEESWFLTGKVRCADCGTTVRARTLESLPEHRCSERRRSRREQGGSGG